MVGLILFLVFFGVATCQECHENCHNTPPTCNKDPTPDFTKCHVILFFTNPDMEVSTSVNDEGMSLLKFPVKGNLQDVNKIPDAYKNLFSIDPNGSCCNSIFDRCLCTLVNWATSVQRMVTATVTTTKKDYVSTALSSNYISPDHQLGIQLYRYSTFNDPNGIRYDRIPPTAQRHAQKMKHKVKNRRLGRSLKNFPVMKYDLSEENFPQESNEDDMKISYDIDEPIMFDLLQKGQPIPKYKVEKVREDKESHKEETTKSSVLRKKSAKAETLSAVQQQEMLNVFDLMAKFRDLFLGGLFGASPDQKLLNSREEDCVDPNVLGKVDENRMFQLVKSTLGEIKEQETLMQTNGYLMVVIGGNISEIQNPFSQLIQSVKYVLEHTNEQNTLVLVSCHCPDKKGCSRKRIPYYARGANSEELRNSLNLVDMFGNIRDTLSPYKWTKHHRGVNKFPLKKSNDCSTNGDQDDNEEFNYGRYLVGDDRMSRSIAGSATKINSTFTIIIIFLYLFDFWCTAKFM